MLSTPIGLFPLSDLHLEVDDFGINVEDPVILIGTRNGGAVRHERGTKAIVEYGPVHFPESIFDGDSCEAIEASNDMLFGAVVVSEADLSADAIAALRETGGSIFCDLSDPRTLD